MAPGEGADAMEDHGEASVTSWVIEKTQVSVGLVQANRVGPGEHVSGSGVGLWGVGENVHGVGVVAGINIFGLIGVEGQEGGRCDIHHGTRSGGRQMGMEGGAR